MYSTHNIEALEVALEMVLHGKINGCRTEKKINLHVNEYASASASSRRYLYIYPFLQTEIIMLICARGQSKQAAVAN